MVTHCICYDISLEQLRDRARRDNLDLEGLKNATGCCTGCGMCEPYVRVMLKTGQIAVPILSPARCAAIMREDASGLRPTPSR
jgi:bacterioferritin-associated ferredoxin